VIVVCHDITPLHKSIVQVHTSNEIVYDIGVAFAVMSTPVAGMLNVSISYVHVHVKFSYHVFNIALTVTV
jgi:hypothetical protein